MSASSWRAPMTGRGQKSSSSSSSSNHLPGVVSGPVTVTVTTVTVPLRGPGTRKRHPLPLSSSSQSVINRDDVDPAACVEEMEMRLRMLSRTSSVAADDVPHRIDPLATVLAMPYADVALSKLARRYERHWKYARFLRWRQSTAALREQARHLRTLRDRASTIIQRRWRGIFGRQRFRAVFERRQQFREARHLCCVVKLQALIRAFVMRRKYRRWLRDTERARLSKHATIIQKIFRGYLAKCLLADRERVLLTRELKSFANGNVHALLDRKDLQDVEAQSMLLMAIKLSNQSSRPLRNLPNLHTVKAYRAAMVTRREESQRFLAQVHQQYRISVSDRRTMEKEDHLSRFRDRYESSLGAMLAAAHREKQERSQREQREEKLRTIRSSALSAASRFSEEAYYETLEREAMCRADVASQRAQRMASQQAWLRSETEREFMKQEDLRAKLLESRHFEQWRLDKALQMEADRVKAVKEKAGISVAWLSSDYERRASASREALAAIDAFNIGSESSTFDATISRYEYIGSNNEGTSDNTLNNSINSVYSHTQSTMRVQVSAESSALARFRGELIQQLRSLRELRHARLRQLQASLASFKSTHSALTQRRMHLRTAKFATRQCRRDYQLVTAGKRFEGALPGMREDVIRHGRALVGYCKLEIQCFVGLFLSSFGQKSDTEEEAAISEYKRLCEEQESDAAQRWSHLQSKNNSKSDKGKRVVAKQQIAASLGARKAMAPPVNLGELKASLKSSGKPSNHLNDTQKKKAPITKSPPHGHQQNSNPSAGKTLSALKDALVAYWEVAPYLASIQDIPDDDVQPLPPQAPTEMSYHDGRQYLARKRPPVQAPTAVDPVAAKLKASLGAADMARMEALFQPKQQSTDDNKSSKKTKDTIYSSVAKKGNPNARDDSVKPVKPQIPNDLDCDDPSSASFDTPGFNLFLDDSAECYDFYKWGLQLWEWVKAMVQWCDAHERRFRERHRSAAVACVQRLQWLRHNSATVCCDGLTDTEIATGRFLCTDSFEAVIANEDASAAATVDFLDVLDFCQLMASSVDVVVAVHSHSHSHRNNRNGAIYETKQNAEEEAYCVHLSGCLLDALYGKHVASFAAWRLLFGHVIDSVEASTQHETGTLDEEDTLNAAHNFNIDSKMKSNALSASVLVPPLVMTLQPAPPFNQVTLAANGTIGNDRTTCRAQSPLLVPLSSMSESESRVIAAGGVTSGLATDRSKSSRVPSPVTERMKSSRVPSPVLTGRTTDRSPLQQQLPAGILTNRSILQQGHNDSNNSNSGTGNFSRPAFAAFCAIHENNQQWLEALMRTRIRIHNIELVANGGCVGDFMDRKNLFSHTMALDATFVHLVKFELRELSVFIKELIQRELLVIAPTSSGSTGSEAGVASSVHFASKRLHLCLKPARKNFYLKPPHSLSSSVSMLGQDAALFVKVLKTTKVWKVVAPTWMLPMARIGQSAGEEPFWRLLLHERNSGVHGQYSRLLKLNSSVDKIAKKFATQLKLRALRSQALYNSARDIVQPILEQECMFYEDARGHEARQQAYDATLARQQLAAVAVAKKKKSSLFGAFFRFFIPQRWAKVSQKATLPASTNAPPYDATYKQLWQRCLQMRSGAPKQTLSIPSPQLVLAQANMDITQYINRMREQEIVDVFRSLKSSAWVDSIIATDLSRHHSRQEYIAASSTAYETPMSTKEVWCCGGLANVVTVLRVVEDELFCPRGVPIVEATRIVLNASILHCRTALASKKPLCEGSRFDFAHFECTRSRLLSEKTLKRLRVYQPVKLLPQPASHMADVWQQLLPSRRHQANGCSGGEDSEQLWNLKHVVLVQCAMRRYLAVQLVARRRLQGDASHQLY